jgi:hypothetical protein
MAPVAMGALKTSKGPWDAQEAATVMGAARRVINRVMEAQKMLKTAMAALSGQGIPGG